MGTLEPGRQLEYAKVGTAVYARYKGDSHWWAAGWESPLETHITYAEWQDMRRLAETNPTLNALMEKTINTYRLMKN